MDELKTTLNFATRIILFITLPATVGLVLLRKEIIEVLFQHGGFDAASTALTAWALPFFAVGLSAFAMVKIIVPGVLCAARHANTRQDRLRCNASEYSAELPVHSAPAEWRAGPGDVAVCVFQFDLAAYHFLQALRIVWRSRHQAIDRKFIGGSIALGVVTYVSDTLAGILRGPLDQKVFALGVTIAGATATYFAVARLLRFRNGRVARRETGQPKRRRSIGSRAFRNSDDERTMG